MVGSRAGMSMKHLKVPESKEVLTNKTGWRYVYHLKGLPMARVGTL